MTQSRVTVDSTAWLAVTPPVACNTVVAFNLGAVDVMIRTVSGDPGTEGPLLGPGFQDVLI